jgi:3-hydroxy-9,10-secoandrosta-1,3,5(10)-triene-9,17-dione monooxygenase reductase component
VSQTDPDVLLPDAASFRAVLGHFATGITVITAMDDGEPVGIAANSFTAVSLEPPLVLFCAAKSSTTWPRIRKAGHFMVNVLDEHQEHISRLFAQKGADRFGQIGWQPSERGPVLDAVHAFLDCTIEAEHDAGDHVIVVGRVHRLGLDAKAGPLLFYQGRYGRLLGTE